MLTYITLGVVVVAAIIGLLILGRIAGYLDAILRQSAAQLKLLRRVHERDLSEYAQEEIRRTLSD